MAAPEAARPDSIRRRSRACRGVMNWKRGAVGLGIALAIIALLGYGLTRDPRTIPSPLPGTPAPVFTLPTMEPVDTVDLRALRGSVVVLNFWASWCGPCRIEHADLVAAAERFQPRGVQFFGLIYQDSPRNAREFLRQLGAFNYPSLLDQGTRTAISYGVTGVPETFIIDAEGTVVFKHNGPITERQLAAVIEPLLADAPQVPVSAAHRGGTE
jgi:cytochrome c biogenesis protein CcmG/thiol:disulfide interchange protein DsbE